MFVINQKLHMFCTGIVRLKIWTLGYIWLMRNIDYRQSQYGKLNTSDALQVVSDLEAGGDSAIYFGLMVTELVANMKARGSENFGPEQAKEILAVMIGTGRFIPQVFVSELQG